MSEGPVLIVQGAWNVIPNPIDGADGGGPAVDRAGRLAAGQSEVRARGSDRPQGRRAGAEVHPQGPGGTRTLAGRIPHEWQGRPGFLPLGRLVTVLSQAVGPTATRPQVHRSRRYPARRHQL